MLALTSYQQGCLQATLQVWLYLGTHTFSRCITYAHHAAQGFHTLYEPSLRDHPNQASAFMPGVRHCALPKAGYNGRLQNHHDQAVIASRMQMLAALAPLTTASRVAQQTEGFTARKSSAARAISSSTACSRWDVTYSVASVQHPSLKRRTNSNKRRCAGKQAASAYSDEIGCTALPISSPREFTTLQRYASNQGCLACSAETTHTHTSAQLFRLAVSLQNAGAWPHPRPSQGCTESTAQITCDISATTDPTIPWSNSP